MPPIERFFNRAIATRYDKLATMFLGGVLATLLAVSLKGIGEHSPEGTGHPEPVVVISQRPEAAIR